MVLVLLIVILVSSNDSLSLSSIFWGRGNCKCVCVYLYVLCVSVSVCWSQETFTSISTKSYQHLILRCSIAFKYIRLQDIFVFTLWTTFATPIWTLFASMQTEMLFSILCVNDYEFQQKKKQNFLTKQFNWTDNLKSGCPWRSLLVTSYILKKQLFIPILPKTNQIPQFLNVKFISLFSFFQYWNLDS